MRIKILGCSGGVGPGLRTTGVLINDSLLIDAGTGVGDLALAEMRLIQHVVLTHSHLDHVCGLAFMADNLFDLVDAPIQVHATDATLKAVRDHLFNWTIWPDFSQIPSPENGLIRWRPMLPGQPLQVADDLRVCSFEVLHTVPAVGVAVEGPLGTFAFSGDTYATPKLWDALNALPRLDLLMIEIAFPDEDAPLAATSRHFSPAVLGQELAQLKHRPQLLLTHHKPGTERDIERECASALKGWNYQHLKAGDSFQL